MRVFDDSNEWCAVGANFVNLQESPAGFADSKEDAVERLVDALEAEVKNAEADNAMLLLTLQHEATCTCGERPADLNDINEPPCGYCQAMAEKHPGQALAKRIAALEKACRPFDALYAVCGVREYDKLASFTGKDGHRRWFTVGELKRLHEALAAMSGTGKEEHPR